MLYCLGEYGLETSPLCLITDLVFGQQRQFNVLQSLRARADAGDKAAALELREGDDELFRQHMQPEERDQENRAKIRRVDPTVNLAADGFDRWSEGATARDHSKV